MSVARLFEEEGVEESLKQRLVVVVGGVGSRLALTEARPCPVVEVTCRHRSVGRATCATTTLVSVELP